MRTSPGSLVEERFSERNSAGYGTFKSCAADATEEDGAESTVRFTAEESTMLSALINCIGARYNFSLL